MPRVKILPPQSPDPDLCFYAHDPRLSRNGLRLATVPPARNPSLSDRISTRIQAALVEARRKGAL